MDYTNPSIGDTLLIALIGFATVFAVLIVLMWIIMLISKVFGEKQKEAPTAPAAPAPQPQAYTGLKLEGVSEKEAAMIMAIVADQMKKTPQELRFISIKEVK